MMPVAEFVQTVKPALKRVKQAIDTKVILH